MYKKATKYWLLLMCFFLGMCIMSNGYAQDYQEKDMDNILVRFCGDGTGIDQLKNSDTIYVEPNEKKELCLFITNAGEKKMLFEYGFSVGAVSNAGDSVCDGDMSTGNKFSMLIPWTHERIIKIDPMSAQMIKENIVIPPGMSGLQLGCLAYKLSNPEYSSMGGMFTLIVRKITHFNIVVGGESTANRTIKILNAVGGAFSTNKKIKTMVDNENNLKLSFLIENQGNVIQNIIITGKIYNALGFQKDFSTEARQLNPGMKNEFIVDAGMLPAYKGLFNIKSTIKSEPIFSFPVANEKLKQPEYIGENANVFIFSWARVVILIVLLLVLYKIFVPKREKTITTVAP